MPSVADAGHPGRPGAERRDNKQLRRDRVRERNLEVLSRITRAGAQSMSFFADRRDPDGVQVTLGAAVLGFRQGVEHIAHLVEPAALGAGGGEDLLQGRPEARGAIADRQQRSVLQAPLLEIQQQILPRGFRLAHAVLDGDPLLAAVWCHTGDHQQALPVTAFGTLPGVDAIDPPVRIPRRG